MSMPGLWKKVPGFLLDPNGPLTIRWSALFGLAPWLWRFVLAGSTVSRVRRTARSLSQLLHDAPDRHVALAKEAGLEHLILRKGLLYAYPDRSAFENERLAWQLRKENGVQWTELNAPDLRERIPQLGDHYTFGAWVTEGAHCSNPGDYVAGLITHAQKQGAIFTQVQATGISRQKGGCMVQADSLSIDCDRVVIACGYQSLPLAETVGDKVPMRSERGYNVVITEAGFELPLPVMPSDGKMANTSTTTGLRISGQVELTHEEAEPNWRRSDILLSHALKAYPALGQKQFDPATMTRWLGRRPSVADGLPVISASSKDKHVYHAFGHGHVGLASGPVTGRLIADLITGKPPTIDPAPYSVTRF
jgi:D-amino-acid dehydrogenase